MPAKNSCAGPIAAVMEDKLLEILEHEQEHIEELLGKLKQELKPMVSSDLLSLVEEQVQEIGKVVKIWIGLYHGLVLLVAAMDPPNTHGIDKSEAGAQKNCPGIAEPFCLEKSHQVSAFSLGVNGEEGWFGFSGHNPTLIGNVEANFTEDKLRSGAQNIQANIIIEKYVDRWVSLKNFLNKKFGDALPDSILQDFSPLECLTSCLDTVPQIRPDEENKNKKTYVTEAFYRIAELWAEGGKQILEKKLLGQAIGSNLNNWETQVKQRLTNVHGWLGMNEEGFKIWLSSIQFPGVQLDSVTLNNDAKVMISGMEAMLETNLSIEGFIGHRCFGYSPDWAPVSLSEAEGYLFKDMSDKAKEHWSNLLSTTYCVLAWKIFHQITPTVKRVLT
jgi:hypothetical protein